MKLTNMDTVAEKKDLRSKVKTLFSELCKLYKSKFEDIEKQLSPNLVDIKYFNK